MKRSALVLAVILFSVACLSAQRSSKDISDVAGVIKSFSDALSHNDADKLMKMTAADYTFITQFGVIQTGEQRVAPIRAGRLKYTSVEYADVKVRVYGNAAVVTSTVTIVATNDSKDISGRFRSTVMLSKHTGKWLMVAAQTAGIP